MAVSGRTHKPRPSHFTAMAPALVAAAALLTFHSPLSGQSAPPPTVGADKPAMMPLGPTNSSLLQDLSNQGDSQVKAKQYDAAIDTYRTLILKLTDPRAKAEIWTRIGDVYRLKGDVLISIKALEQALSLVPGNSSILTNIGLLYETQGDRVHARQYYQRALASDLNNPLALNNLAFLLAETGGDLDQALGLATAAKKLAPKAPEVIDTIAWIHMKKNMLSDAANEFKMITEQVPASPVFHLHYAITLNKQGNKTDANRECQAALNQKPDKVLEEQIRQECSETIPAK